MDLRERISFNEKKLINLLGLRFVKDDYLGWSLVDGDNKNVGTLTDKFVKPGLDYSLSIFSTHYEYDNCVASDCNIPNGIHFKVDHRYLVEISFGSHERFSGIIFRIEDTKNHYRPISLYLDDSLIMGTECKGEKDDVHSGIEIDNKVKPAPNLKEYEEVTKHYLPYAWLSYGRKYINSYSFRTTTKDKDGKALSVVSTHINNSSTDKNQIRVISQIDDNEKTYDLWGTVEGYMRLHDRGIKYMQECKKLANSILHTKKDVLSSVIGYNAIQYHGLSMYFNEYQLREQTNMILERKA